MRAGLANLRMFLNHLKLEVPAISTLGKIAIKYRRTKQDRHSGLSLHSK